MLLGVDLYLHFVLSHWLQSVLLILKVTSSCTANQIFKLSVFQLCGNGFAEDQLAVQALVAKQD